MPLPTISLSLCARALLRLSLCSRRGQVVGWQRRPDDPHVTAYRARLERENGLPELVVCEPHEVERAAAAFWRDGFVCVRNVLSHDQVARLKTTARRALAEIMKHDPDASFGHSSGLSHRYAFGECSVTRHLLHEPDVAALVDLPTTTPILSKIFGSTGYKVHGAGGDVVLPGAIEYQRLHRDIQDVVGDPEGDGTTLFDLPCPQLTVNFPCVDITKTNGPLRQLAGSHRKTGKPPSLADETTQSKMSTLCPLPAGSAIFRKLMLIACPTVVAAESFRKIANCDAMCARVQEIVEGCMAVLPT